MGIVPRVAESRELAPLEKLDASARTNLGRSEEEARRKTGNFPFCLCKEDRKTSRRYG